MYECVGGRGNTRTQDIWEKGGCVTTGRRRKEEACLFSLSLKSECSNIEKLVGSQRETADTLRETCGLRLVSH